MHNRKQLTMLHLITACIGFQLVLTLPLEGDGSFRQLAINFSEFPYQVLISELDESPKCGGVLVGEGLILTSATCVWEFGGTKRFIEEAVLYGGGVGLLYDLGDISDAVIHPKYVMSSSAFDVAVVKYIPEGKGPQLNKTLLTGTWNIKEPCIMTSWWATPDIWPERLVWSPVSIIECSPAEMNLFCFTDDTVVFHKADYGSPVVCSGVLTGLIPHGEGRKAINITSDYQWITETMVELAKSVGTLESSADEETKLYLNKILQRLDVFAHEKSNSEVFGDHLTNWNNQIVVPLSYVLFAMVIFFFVLLFFIILFTVVLVYYSKK